MNRRSSRRARALSAAFALFVPLSLSVGVSPARAQATASATFTPAPLFSRSDITFRTLPSGVRVILKRAAAPDQVCVQVWVRAGSRFEKEGENGVAHLIELAAMRGSKRFPTGDDESGGANGVIRAVGGESGALSSRDATFYSATVAKSDWSRALGALADAVLQPTLTNDAVDEARAVAYGDLTRRLIDPVSAASDLAYATAFSKHPYRRSAIGSQTTLNAVTAAKVRDYHKRHYVGKNISVVIVGDVKPEAALDAVRRTFASASSAAAPKLQLPAEPVVVAKEIARRSPTLEGATALAWRSAGVKSAADVLALDTLLALWREGLDANLRRALLRDGTEGPRKPIVGAFDVDFLTQRDPGLFMVNFTGYSDPAEAVQVVLDEVKRVQEQGISPEELLRAKQQLRYQYLEQSENVAGQAGALGFYEMIDSYEFAVDYLARASRVTAADIQRVAKQYLRSDRLVRAEIQSLQLPKSGPNEDPLNTDRIEINFPMNSSQGFGVAR